MNGQTFSQNPSKQEKSHQMLSTHLLQTFD